MDDLDEYTTERFFASELEELTHLHEVQSKRIAELEAELAATKAELAGWREMERMIGEFRANNYRPNIYTTPAKWHIRWSSYKSGKIFGQTKWFKGATLPEAVKAGYEEVVGDE